MTVLYVDKINECWVEKVMDQESQTGVVDTLIETQKKLQSILITLQKTSITPTNLVQERATSRDNEDSIGFLKKQIKELIQEKKYWMEKCKELSSQINHSQDRVHAKCTGQETIPRDIRGVLVNGNENPIALIGGSIPNRSRRRTNSELQLLADTLSLPTVHVDDDSKQDVMIKTSNSPSKEIHGSLDNEKKCSFRLLQCSDEQCEIFKPRNGKIRTSHHSRTNIQLMWDSPPEVSLVVMKPNDSGTTKAFLSIIQWLVKKRNKKVFIEPQVYGELKQVQEFAMTWKEEEWEKVQSTIDFIICLGGDGTILWSSGLFSEGVPPLISFSMGSLGFLTPFDWEHFTDHLDRTMQGGFFLSLRQRISCTIIRNAHEMDEDQLGLHATKAPFKDKYHALNEVVIDRGLSAALVDLDCYVDNLLVTKVAADGIIIGSPTGSTAYSLSAGGSMVHPAVPTMLFTPICPHSLSFRPMLFPDSATVKIMVPISSRYSAFVSFDGKNRLQLNKGDALFVKVSSYPVPVICKITENEDWFESVKENLNWNQRKAQKSFENSGKEKTEEKKE